MQIILLKQSNVMYCLSEREWLEKERKKREKTEIKKLSCISFRKENSQRYHKSKKAMK